MCGECRIVSSAEHYLISGAISKQYNLNTAVYRTSSYAFSHTLGRNMATFMVEFIIFQERKRYHYVEQISGGCIGLSRGLL